MSDGKCCSGGREAGQALVEGVVALVLLGFATVLAALLLVNVGLVAYYKEKLGLVSNQAASFAFQRPRSEDSTAITTQFADELMTSVGLPATNTRVIVDKNVTLSGQPAVRVNVSTNLRVLGQTNVFPLTIPVSDAATVAYAGSGALDQQTLFRTLGIGGVVTVSARNGGNVPTSVCIPAFGQISGVGGGFTAPPSRQILPNRSLFDAQGYLYPGGY